MIIQVSWNEREQSSPVGKMNDLRKITLTFIKESSPPEPLSQFQPNLAQVILGWRKLKSIFAT